MMKSRLRPHVVVCSRGADRVARARRGNGALVRSAMGESGDDRRTLAKRVLAGVAAGAGLAAAQLALTGWAGRTWRPGSVGCFLLV